MNKKEKQWKRKQFRREKGAAKGYQAPIILDAFEFWGKDISDKRVKFYEGMLKKRNRNDSNPIGEA